MIPEPAKHEKQKEAKQKTHHPPKRQGGGRVNGLPAGVGGFLRKAGGVFASFFFSSRGRREKKEW
jgi:hypothetical protein